MYIYDCNTILTTVLKNRSDKDMMQAFIEFNIDFKSRRINPVFHFMEKNHQQHLNCQWQPWTPINSWLPQVITGWKMQRYQSRFSRTLL